MSPIFWQAFGDPAGPAALAVHCALGRGRDLGAGLHRLPLATTALDLPGHGASAAWDGFEDYHTACTDAARAGLDQPRIVIGHSLGATVALRLALEAPDLVRALILIEPVLFAAAKDTPEMRAHSAFDARFAALMNAGDYAGAAAGFLDLWGVGVPFAAMPQADRTRITAQMPLIAATGAALFDDTAGLLRAGRLEGLDMPVLLLRGTGSPAITRAINAALATRLPHATQAEITGASHMAPVAHPRDVAAQITTFLDRL